MFTRFCSNRILSFEKRVRKYPQKNIGRNTGGKFFVKSGDGKGKLFLAIKKDIILEMISSKFTVFLFVLVEIVLV